MAQKIYAFRTPYGSTMRQAADGSYYLYYEETEVVGVRDWIAGMANEFTDEAVNHLKGQEERIKQDRADRQAAIKHAANPIKAITKEVQRVNGKLEMMAPTVVQADGIEEPFEDDEVPVAPALPPAAASKSA